MNKQQNTIRELELKLASKDAEESRELVTIEKSLEQAQDQIRVNETTIESLQKDADSKEADIQRLEIELASKSDQLTSERENLRAECVALRVKLESLVRDNSGNKSPLKN